MTIKSAKALAEALDPECCSVTPIGYEIGGGILFVKRTGAGGDVSTKSAFEKAKRDGLIRQTDVGHESGVWVTA